MFTGYPAKFEVFGAVKVYELVKIYSLFAYGFEKPGVVSLPRLKDLEDVAQKTVFIVPIKNEEPVTFEGVLKAIPHHSPIVVVSNSSLRPFNRYKVELDIAKSIYKMSGKTIVVVHQRDPIIAEKLRESLPEMLDEDGLVRNGKGEGMLIGALIADALRAENIAFVDADNHIPSTVLEYALIYYTMLSFSESKYKMIRIMWAHKGWTTEEFFLRRFGRVSTAINTVLNKVLSFKRKRETDIIKTSNSGEHAMSMDLVKMVEWGSGFSIETQELVSILEKCYIDLDNGYCPALPENIEIYQVESLSPHIHAEKGDEHIAEMLIASLSAIYHSKLADEKSKIYILNVAKELGYAEELPKIPRYRYPEMNARELLDALASESKLSIVLT
uniref:Mannosyl-3-phosphoglycerate synthase n=1 Tax=Ignisphaera aggregans TaxID=334771 RepID=A0A7C4FGQ6_9CREN